MKIAKMNPKALPYLIATSLAMALQVVLTKVAINQGINILSVIFWALLLAAAISLVFALKNISIMKKWKGAIWRDLIIIGVLGNGLATIIMFQGQAFTTAINAGFFVQTSPIFTIIIAWLWIKERLSLATLAAVAIAFFGFFLLSTGGALNMPALGDIMITFSALLFGYVAVYAKKIMPKVKEDMISAWRIIFGSLFVAVVAPLFFGSQTMTLPASALFYIVAIAVFQVTIVFSLFRGIKVTGPSVATIFLLSSAVISAVLAFVSLGETLSTIQILGAGLALVGLYFVSR